MKNLSINIESTPNPNSRKFVMPESFWASTPCVFKNLIEAKPNVFASNLFEIRGVSRVFLKDNFVTISKLNHVPWDEMTKPLKDFFTKSLSKENPLSLRHTKSPMNISGLPLVKEIVERAIRPALRADGGDIEVVSLQNNVITIRYQGSCNNCPSSTGGTLTMIKQILREQYDPEIDVKIIS